MIRIVEIKQLGVGWEVWFLPADQEGAVRSFLEGQGLRVVQMRRDTLPEIGEVSSASCERPGEDLLKVTLVEIFEGDDRFEVAEHLAE